MWHIIPGIHACGFLSILLEMSLLQHHFKTAERRLLRILFLWEHPLPPVTKTRVIFQSVAWEGLLSTSSSFTQIARRHTKTPFLRHISIFNSPSKSDFIPKMFYLCFTLL